MFKLSEETPKPTDTITMDELRPCQIGVIINDDTIGPHDGGIVMRTANDSQFEVMNLSNPGRDRCWTENESPGLIKVRVLPPGTKVTLEVV